MTNLFYSKMSRKSVLNIVIFILVSMPLMISCSLFSGQSSEEEKPPLQQEVEAEEIPEQESSVAPEEDVEIEPEQEPLKIFVDPTLPEDVKEASIIHLLGKEISLITEREDADLVMTLSSGGMIDTNSYLLSIITDFFTIEDNTTWEKVVSFWQGHDTDIFSEGPDTAVRPLILEEDIFYLLEKILGECKSENLIKASSPEMIDENILLNEGSFAIVPFEHISNKHKVISIDGMNILDKRLDLKGYPLKLSVVLEQNGDPVEDIPEDILEGLSFTNRDPEKIVTINMTGVTAMTRGTANRMDRYGVLYPAEEIAHILQDADITHISNEVSFVEDCTGYQKGSLRFCSKPEYMELIKHVGTDVVELTGNHLNDYGRDWFVYSLDYYEEEGLLYYGGGRNIEEAYEPVFFEIGEESFAFLGANSFGPASDWAEEEKAGTARINMWDETQMEEDFLKIEEIIEGLKSEGYTVIFTFQYMETYNYMPVEQQVTDFRRVIDMGADIVSGSQAHQPQGMELYNGSFINYGLGNLFFDQMQNLGVRQGIIARHVFYEGKHINTILITTMLEDYCQPRLTTEEERIQLLNSLYSGSIR